MGCFSPCGLEFPAKDDMQKLKELSLGGDVEVAQLVCTAMTLKIHDIVFVGCSAMKFIR